ncbi:H+/gluconate symporter-like permease [Salinibacter ruber]|uniref:hypothetical protein n=1 Tax=Salinibacter ruber TaxID=146919 RepID=UPI002169BEF4|nr:hypothetical protein [Salinibacter ruber]MCS3956698.1 H+/gluconate symporter-like permease [Salinibacter ruber]
MDPTAVTFIVGVVIGGVAGLAGSLSKRLVRVAVSLAVLSMGYALVTDGGIGEVANNIREMLSGAFKSPALLLGIIGGFIFTTDEDSVFSRGQGSSDDG